MDLTVSNSLPAFGFLTVVEHPGHGFFGGYLVLSDLGRPLEFHCSTPILPTQAQRILYGSTLRSYLLGEIIGQTLVRKAQLPVLAVLTDLEDMLSLGLVWEGVLAWVTCEPEATSSTNIPMFASSCVSDDTDRLAEAGSPSLEMMGFRLRGSETCSWEPKQLRAALAPLVSHVELTEPFERIREAIHEAQRVTSAPAGEPQAGEPHEQTAAA